MPEEAAKSASRPASPTTGHHHGGSGIRHCTVQLLDDVPIQVEFKKTDPGSVIFEQVCDHLNLVERDYFGLRFMDHNLHRYWLDPVKPIAKQIKNADSIVFAFRVKFYPADPTILKEEFTRYQLVLQLRRDLLHGRLHCLQNDLASLASYIVQAELGDYDPLEHVGNYVSQFKILINQTPRIEEKIAQMHKNLKGQQPSEVDLNFLKKASSLDTYGYYPYTIKDSKAGQVYTGATPKGVLIYQTSRKLHHLPWAIVEDMDYSGKEFYIYPTKSYFDECQTDNSVTNGSVGGVTTAKKLASSGDYDHHSSTTNRPRPASATFDDTASRAGSPSPDKDSKKRPMLKFICPNATFSKQMWKYMLAQKAFFTCPKSEQVKPVVKRHLLFKNATFRWHPTSRVLEELKDVAVPSRPCPTYERLKIPRQANRDERSGPWANKFHTMPSRTIKPVSDGALNSHSGPAATSSAEAPELMSMNRSAPVRPSILRPMTGDNLKMTTTTTLSSIASSAASIESPLQAAGADAKTPSVSPVGGGYATATTVKTTTPTTAAGQPLTSTPKRPTQATTYQEVFVTKTILVHDSQSKKLQDQNVYVSSKGVISSTGQQRDNAVRWFLRLLLLVLLFSFLLAALVVAGMESKDPWVRRQLNGWPVVDQFRHAVYNPTRRFLCSSAQRLFY